MLGGRFKVGGQNKGEKFKTMLMFLNWDHSGAILSLRGFCEYLNENGICI